MPFLNVPIAGAVPRPKQIPEADAFFARASFKRGNNRAANLHFDGERLRRNLLDTNYLEFGGERIFRIRKLFSERGYEFAAVEPGRLGKSSLFQFDAIWEGAFPLFDSSDVCFDGTCDGLFRQ